MPPQTDTDTDSTSQSLFIEILGTSPDDLPLDESPQIHSDIAADIYRLLEEYGIDNGGVAVCINDDAHSQLNDALATDD